MKRRQRGMSLVELAMAIGLAAVALLIGGVAYRTLVRGELEVRNAAGLQLRVKALSRQIEADVGRAGFGLDGAAAFLRLEPRDLEIRYKDLLNTYCGSGDTVSLRFRAEKRALVKELKCNGSPLPVRRSDVSPDSLEIGFRYLDNTGMPAASPSRVRTVEFTVGVLTPEARDLAARIRLVKGRVDIANNP